MSSTTEQNPVKTSLELLRECRAVAFVDAAVTDLERIVASIGRAPALADRALGTLVTRHRVVRDRLARHCGGEP